MTGTESRMRADFWGNLERRMNVEWLVVTVSMLALTTLLCVFSSRIGLERIDHAFYDRVLSTAMHPDPSSDIVIVAIDDGSIEQIGYWPWRRALHAQLLDRLAQARAVGLDVLLSDLNPAYPNDDQVLAEAMRRHGRVVLPSMIANDRQAVVSPLPALASASAGSGYINVYPDNDGVVRALTLSQEGGQGQPLRHFLTAMLKAGGEQARLPAGYAPGKALRIAYHGGPGSYTSYPYAQILEGKIPASAFQGKYVLVGSWGSGLGDAFPTPVSPNGLAMSGVEILANGLQDLIADSWIVAPPAWLDIFLAWLPVLAACLAFRRRSPRKAFMVVASVWLVVMAGSAALLLAMHIWIPVTAALAGVGLAFPVWSWRSQEASLQHIDRELQALNRERLALGDEIQASQPAQRDGSLSARVTQLHGAIGQLREARHRREQTLRFLSHDMRSPQNSILALTQLQSQPQTALQQDELLQRIDGYAHKTLNLVDGFVHLARAEAMQLRMQYIDLVELVQQCADDFWAPARQRDIEILADDMPGSAWMRGDAALVRRALSNLMDNAIKYSPAHTRVQCGIAHEASFWRVSLRDQGRGMSAEGIASLFQPFTRLDEDQPDNPSGAGLGLAFVQTVAERHHGTISVNSREGEGTEFILRFPAADIQAHQSTR